jgi:hypothetical protein
VALYLVGHRAIGFHPRLGTTLVLPVDLQFRPPPPVREELIAI